MVPNRIMLLVIDGLALLGLIVFSVLGALNPDQSGYVVAQIVCAVVVLVTVFVLRRTR